MSDAIYLFPTSFAQQRLWFLDQLMPGNPFYNMAAAIPLSVPLDVGILERSLSEIVRRHEVLRTTFTAVRGEPFQVVSPPATLRVPVEDLQDLPPAERDAAVQRAVTAETVQPFDLARGPLLRVRLLRLARTEHVFVLVMHHIVSDGWSVGLLFQELAGLYSAYAAGQPSPLPDLPIQYADYAVWQREWLQGEVLDRHVAYWKTQLAGAPTLQLHTDRPRPTAQTFRGAYERVEIAPALTRRVQALGRQHDATLFMTLLAAFDVLLHRHTGQDDLVIGLPVAGRNRRELEGLIGFFINSLVLRTDLSGDPTFRELLARVRDVTLQAFAHQELPFEKLVEELHLERDLSRNPLFQITFQLINAPTLEARDQPAAPRRAPPPPPVPEVQRGTAIFDLAFDLKQVGEGLHGYFEYSTDLFDADTIRRLAARFQLLLEAITADPGRRLSELRCLSDEERELLAEWNATERAVAEPLVLHAAFERQAAATPDAVAVVAGATQLAYGELNAQANRCAHLLRERGVGPGALVGVCMERSAELVISLLGVLKAGAAYVPLDAAYPAERLRAMLDGVALVLTAQGQHRALPPHVASVVRLDEARLLLDAQRTTDPPACATPDDLAYVLYTSGSTGAPKGVMIPHRAICNHMHWMQSDLPLGPDDRVLQRTPTTFDASVWEFFAPLMAGARLVLAPPGAHGDPARLVALIQEQGVTVAQFVPSLLDVLLRELDVARCTSLRRVFSGGEPLTRELHDRFFATLSASLHNLYGPTECSIDATAWRCLPDDPWPVVPIGRPIANVRAYVLDAAGQPAPVGVPGELYLGGVGLARGYLGQPALTAARFVPDPFAARPGARLYRTGDRVRWTAAGALQFLGRLDEQVKLRGYRIELGEVEAALRRHPAVRQAVALVREDAPGDRRLVAYVVADEPAPPPDALRQLLGAHLPEHMIPAHIVPLDAVPLTTSGKVDRGHLPAPDRHGLALAESYAAPRTSLERLLARLWADVLDLDRVGIHHGFFNELGGHSLLATQLISRVRDLLSVEVPLQRIFEAPTVAGFAASLAGDGAEQARLEAFAEFYLMVEQMSDEEADAMLARAARPA